MKKILVVDDSRIMRNIVKNTFLKLGIPCEFIEADNGEVALNIIKEQKLDLVLLDWNMPKLSGVNLLKVVREIPEYKELPIIMVTSEAARYSVIEALKTGATAYLLKPINEEKFTKTFKNLKLFI